MPSTYNDFKIELMATGENDTTWGAVTNLNLDALVEAIGGSATVTFASANQTISLTDTNAAQTARNMRLYCGGVTGGAQRNLVVPTIEKAYIVSNACADGIQVKTSAGTGIVVPAGKTMWLFVDGTNVVDVSTYMTSVTLGSALGVASGGTGVTSTPSNGQLLIGNGTGYTAATLTAGTGVSITNGAGSITVNCTIVTGSGGGTTNFLRADGTWTVPVGTTTNSLTMNSSGTGDASGTTFTGSAARTISYNTIGAVPTGAVTTNGITMATARMLGRTTASTGAIEEISIGANLSLSGGSLNTGATVALLASPTFTGTPAAPTAAVGTSTTQIATTAFVRTPSIQSVTSSATVTPTFADDQVNITAQAAGLTLANPTGTAQDAAGISIRIKDNGTARSISYGTQYRAIGVTLPTTTVINKTLYLGMIFNNADTKWDVVAVAQEA